MNWKSLIHFIPMLSQTLGIFILFELNAVTFSSFVTTVAFSCKAWAITQGSANERALVLSTKF